MLLQTLNILEHFDLQAMGHNSGEYIHTITEALKIAYADREQFYGDPKFVTVPMQWLTGQRVWHNSVLHVSRLPPVRPCRIAVIPGRLTTRLSPQDTQPASQTIPANTEDNDNLDTSYICVVDQAGNCVSAVPSDMSFSAGR